VCFVWMCILFECDISWKWMRGMDVGESVFCLDVNDFDVRIFF